mmetsp:Transcript_18520/g.53589  ORF Transcript_18520/g.53589 Transcript_18520/m.53589 type:complete len:93 (+) Transcript_18520:673-951(+)
MLMRSLLLHFTNTRKFPLGVALLLLKDTKISKDFRHGNDAVSLQLRLRLLVLSDILSSLRLFFWSLDKYLVARLHGSTRCALLLSTIGGRCS